MKPKLVWLFLVVLVGFGGGCRQRPALSIKPTIAILRFDNHAATPGNWDLGNGMKDVLVDRLMKTNHYHVIERPDIEALLHEIQFQNSGVTRPQDRARIGQLKNVQYVVKGSITDFSQVAGGSAYAQSSRWRLFGSGDVAVVSIMLYVIQVESGEIISSTRLEQAVHAGRAAVQSVYKDVTFGGSVFYRTPLGQATAKVLDRAVDQVSAAVVARPWEPRIAAVSPGQVIINGGQERGLRVGAELSVLEAGTPIVDPDTGDTIGQHGGRIIGQICRPTRR